MTSKQGDVYYGSIEVSGGVNVRDEVLADVDGMLSTIGVQYQGTVDAGCTLTIEWVSPSGRTYTVYELVGNTDGIYPILYGSNDDQKFITRGGQLRLTVSSAGASATGIDYDLPVPGF